MRDPKLDPQPGDVLSATGRAGQTLRREVTRRDGNDIYYKTPGKLTEKSMWIVTWLDWAREAEVLTTAN